MTPKLKAQLKKVLGYPALFAASFAFFVYVTFPYRALETNLVALAKANGVTLTIGSLGPGLFGATAERIRVAIPVAGADNPPAIVIDKVSARPSLFPPGLSVSARSFGGKASGSVAALRKRPGFKLTLSGIDVAKAGLKEAVGIDAAGIVGGRIAVDIDPQDVTKWTGDIEFEADDVVVNGGTVQNIDLPKMAVGDVEGLLKVEQGKATVDHFTVKGADVEAEADGDVTLHARLLYSSPRLRLRFKPAPAWLDKYSFIKTGLAFAGTPDAKGFYTVFVEGLLGNLRPRLQR